MLKIDVHNHLYPENYWDTTLKISEKVNFPVDVRRIMTYCANKGLLVKPEEAIKSMETLGIGDQVLSLHSQCLYACCCNQPRPCADGQGDRMGGQR